MLVGGHVCCCWVCRCRGVGFFVETSCLWLVEFALGRLPDVVLELTFLCTCLGVKDFGSECDEAEWLRECSRMFNGNGKGKARPPPSRMRSQPRNYFLRE